MMKQIKCQSGLSGTQERLQDRYSSFEEFEHYSSTYGITKRLGFNGDRIAWNANPLIEGSVEPSDLRVSPGIHVGDGITCVVGSDRYSYTIVEILSPKKIVVQKDREKRIDNNGMSEDQTWAQEMDEQGATTTITLRKNGFWFMVGDSMKGCPYVVGMRLSYRDPHF